MTGVDIDVDKLVVANGAGARSGTSVTFEAASEDGLPPGPWDAVTIVDMLYLLEHERARSLVLQAAEVVRPGGVVVVKETDITPWWKFKLAQLQELTSTRVLRITEGTGVRFVPPAEIAALLESAGLTVERMRLDRHSTYPHHLVLGRRPT